jgi:hypothetical protein
MGKTRWRTTAIALFGLTLLAGCRTPIERSADTYVVQEIVFLNERAASPEVEAECPVLPSIQAALIQNGAKHGITVLAPAAGKDNPNKISVLVDQVEGGRFSSVISPNSYVVTEIFATLSIEDGKGRRERETNCRIGIGFALQRATVCHRIALCTDQLGVKMMNWLQRTR